MKRIGFVLLAIGSMMFIGANFASAQFTPVASTGLPYQILITNVPLNITVGDQVGAFDMYNAAEVCVGAAFNTGTGQIGITVWEHTAAPPLDQPGFTDGNPIILRVWDSETGIIYDATLTFDATLPGAGDGTYGSVGFAYVSSIVTAAAIPTVGEWGLIVMSLLFLISGTLVMRWQKATAPAC
ncbi:MAG: IPTL-CTERM sorting domain-containing protein [Planctomycetes bacterium]|nr:IPTL-CTERM sorting domain-containing protein [Planctomycetota bacterium]